MTVVLAACSSRSDDKSATRPDLPTLSQPSDTALLSSWSENRGGGGGGIMDNILDEPTSAIFVTLRCESRTGTIALEVGIPVNQDPTQDDEGAVAPDYTLKERYDASATCSDGNEPRSFRFDLPQLAQVVTTEIKAMDRDVKWSALVAASTD
jgi:hypothetical protein